MRFADIAPLRRFLLVSLAMHALLLTLFPSEWLTALPPNPSAGFQAKIVAPAALPSRTAAPSVPAVPLDLRPAKSRESRVARPVVEGPVAMPVTALPETAATVAAAAASAEKPAATVAAAPQDASVHAVPQELRADGLREYRVAVGREAQRLRAEYARKYRDLERERQRGWEGRVEMLVRASALLPAPTVQLVRSSGHAALDEQAMELIGRAVRTTALPPSLAGRSFSLPMVMEFRMHDAD